MMVTDITSNESLLTDLRIKNLLKIEEIEKEELKIKNENINSSLDDGDWSSYKKNKKNFIFGNIKKKQLKKKINTNLINNNFKFLKMLKYNSVNFLKLTELYFKRYEEKNRLNNQLFNLYNRLNLKRINSIKNDDFFKNVDKKIVLIIDIRQLKAKIIAIYKNKCILTITPGIIFNKLRMKEKSLKKTQKVFNLMIKLVITSLKKNINCNNFIINIRGTKSKITNIVLFIKKNFNKKTDKILFIYTPNIDFKLKFKKIKSIKRRLKKKIIRFR